MYLHECSPEPSMTLPQPNKKREAENSDHI